MAPSSKNAPAQSPALFGIALDIANGRHQLSKLSLFLLWAFDAVLCGLVIWKVAYTEIDWKAYMEQIQQIVDGEHTYTEIKGGTGPLVYPAFHVWIYTGLYYLTNCGTNILLAQKLFAVLYMLTLAVVMACYRNTGVPPYIMPLLVLSKRIHSIFVLRCFNDCFAIFFLWLAIFMFQHRLWSLGTLSYALGLGVKMTLLTALPGVAVVLFLGTGLPRAIRLAMLMVQCHVAIAVPFLKANVGAYMGRAFELSRVFKYKWTVNMRFLPEEVFLSTYLAYFLMGCFILNILLFMHHHWMEPAKVPFPKLALSILAFQVPYTKREEGIIAARVNERFIATTILTSMNAGMLFARSLHYQFYVYIAWTTPLLLWHADVHPALIAVVWAIQEWAWNVFPSTSISSAVVVAALLFTDRMVFKKKVETPLVPAVCVEVDDLKKTK